MIDYDKIATAIYDEVSYFDEAVGNAMDYLDDEDIDELKASIANHIKTAVEV